MIQQAQIKVSSHTERRNVIAFLIARGWRYVYGDKSKAESIDYVTMCLSDYGVIVAHHDKTIGGNYSPWRREQDLPVITASELLSEPESAVVGDSELT